MSDTDPLFIDAHDPDMASRTIGGVKAALDLDAKADQADLATEVSARASGDAALDSAKAPLVHTHGQGDITGLSAALASKSDTGHTHTGLSVQAAGTPSVRQLGTGATDAAAGNDSRLSDARPPTAHAHNQSDVDGLVAALNSKAVASDLTQEVINRANADLALASAKMDKLTGTTSQYVRGDGSLATFPSVPAAQVQSDWNQANNALVDFIKNKPAPFSVGAATASSVTLNSAFQPSATKATVVSIIGSFTALVSGGVTLSVSTSPTETGTYTEVGVTNLITLLTALSNAKETLTVPVPAGHWLKVAATGGTPTVSKVVWVLS